MAFKQVYNNSIPAEELLAVFTEAGVAEFRCGPSSVLAT